MDAFGARHASFGSSACRAMRGAAWDALATVRNGKGSKDRLGVALVSVVTPCRKEPNS
jgi:hypothetical protein